MEIQVAVFWVVTLCSYLHPEYPPCHYMASQPSRLQLEVNALLTTLAMTLQT